MNVRLKSARGRTASSQRWLERQLNDPYVVAAKRDGWRSRAAFKLIEVDDKHRFPQTRHERVIDLGAAPGGWSQVAAQRVKATDGNGQVVAIDYLAFDPDRRGRNSATRFSWMRERAGDMLKALLRDGRADVVLSDIGGADDGPQQHRPLCASWGSPKRRSPSRSTC